MEWICTISGLTFSISSRALTEFSGIITSTELRLLGTSETREAAVSESSFLGLSNRDFRYKANCIGSIKGCEFYFLRTADPADFYSGF